MHLKSLAVAALVAMTTSFAAAQELQRMGVAYKGWVCKTPTNVPDIAQIILGGAPSDDFVLGLVMALKYPCLYVYFIVSDAEVVNSFTVENATYDIVKVAWQDQVYYGWQIHVDTYAPAPEYVPSGKGA